MQNSNLAGLSILIIEDELLLRKQIAAYLEKQGADVTGIGTLAGAKQLLWELNFDVALLDIHLPDGSGIDLLKGQAFSNNTNVVVMTADGGVAGAVEAMRLGASDYLVKPFEAAELPLVIQRARRGKQSARLEEHRRNDNARSSEAFMFGSALAAVEAQLQKILSADRRLQVYLPPVMIEGETGTGKTTVARWLHSQGPRSAQPLVEMNCSAVPETLAESELFGHERGAFTDARTARIGLLEAAHGGTLFLDELPSLSLALQAKLLKALEDHQIRRLGGNKAIGVDVRIIAATNRDIKQLMAIAQFREDLYHRLDLYRICLPPLRDRGDEIITLAEMLMKRICQRHRLPVKRVSDTGRRRLLAYRWPGNVRELAHELERALIFEESADLHFPLLAVKGEPPMPDVTVAPVPSPVGWLNEKFTFPASGFLLEAAIDRFIQLALKQSNQNVSAAARLLGVSRDYLRYRLADRKPKS